MPFKLPNATHETTTTSGTGPLTLLGAVTDRKTFGSQLSNGDTTMIVTTDGTDWECAIGTFTSPSTISRDTVIYSTNGNALVNWPGSGTRDVYVAPPGEAFASLIDPGMANGLVRKTASRTYEAFKLFMFSVGSTGTGVGVPSGWSVAKGAGSGYYTVTHNLGHTNYSVNVSVDSASGQGAAIFSAGVDSRTTTTFAVWVAAIATATLTDARFSVIVRDLS